MDIESQPLSQVIESGFEKNAPLPLNQHLKKIAAVIVESTLPIRFSPTPTKCGVGPFSGVEPVEGRRSRPTGDSEQ